MSTAELETPRRAARLPDGLRGAGIVLLALVVPVGGILVWQSASDNGLLSPLLFPAPSSIWNSAVGLAQDGRLLDHLGASLGLAGAGLVFGGLTAVLVGTIVGLSRPAEEALAPTLLIVQIVPGLAILPLLVLLFGGDAFTKVLVVALAVFFPVYLNTVQGIRSVDIKLVEIGRILGYGPAQVAWRILIPNALPLVFVGLRQSLKLAWVGVVGVELFIASSAGITFMMVEARGLSQTSIVYLGLFLYAMLGALSDLLLRSLEFLTLPWNRRSVTR